MKPIFDWSFALEILPTLGSALIITIQATVLGMLVAVTLGLALALLRRSRLAIVSLPTAFVIEFVRSTPLLVQMYFLFYVMPLTGVQLSPLATGIVALGLHYATYCAEVYRAGIEAVPRGQIEASRSLGVGYWTTMRKVGLPQALFNVLPSMTSQFVSTIKETSLGYVISVNELTFAANQVNNLVLTQPLQVFGILAIIYFVVCFSLSRGLSWLDLRIRRQRAMA